MSHVTRLAALVSTALLLPAQSFEVASVKSIPSDSPSREPQIDRQTFVLSGTLYDFITAAYGFRPCARKGAAGVGCKFSCAGTRVFSRVLNKNSTELPASQSLPRKAGRAGVLHRCASTSPEQSAAFVA